MPLLIRIWQWALTEQLSSTTWVSNWGQGGWDCLGVWCGKHRFQWLSEKGIKHLLQKCTLGYYCNSCPRSVWHLIPSLLGAGAPSHAQTACASWEELCLFRLSVPSLPSPCLVTSCLFILQHKLCRAKLICPRSPSESMAQPGLGSSHANGASFVPELWLCSQSRPTAHVRAQQVASVTKIPLPMTFTFLFWKA